MEEEKKQSWFARQKLNTKFTIMIGVLLFVPVCLLIVLLFQSQQNDMKKQSINNLKYSMSQTYATVQKTVDLCNTSTQVFLGYRNLNEHLASLKAKEPIDTLTLVDFYNKDIGMLQKLVNSNPYLYQIRVYATSDDFYEMMPILFKRERMLKFPWADSYVSGEWEFDYQDVVGGETVNTSKHTMGLITSINDFDLGEIGVIEVAVRMDSVFENMFKSNDKDWIGFVDRNGKIFSGSDGASLWEINKKEVVKNLMSKGGDGKREVYFETSLHDKRVIVGILPIKELGGTLVRIISLEENYQAFSKTRSVYLFGIMVVFSLLIVLVNVIVRTMLKQFYKVMDTIQQIQEGDLDARVGVHRSDEMGQLGMQIDKLMDMIDGLIQENINRELLMKNSEIKALQNQINAHFIYNVLESIKMMAEIDEKYAISDAVTSLGKLLRYGMKWTTQNVTVGQELEYVKDYLELANLRFDYEVHLALNIPKWAYSQEIPKISLQPIVENAIYHGIEELAEDASIYIKAYMEDQDFYIEITDSGKGMSEQDMLNIQKKIAGEMETTAGSGNGIGLKNVQDRIRISFGEQYGISIISKQNCFTKVIVRLPITNWEAIKNG